MRVSPDITSLSPSSEGLSGTLAPTDVQVNTSLNEGTCMPVNRGGFILCAGRGEVEALSFASLIPEPSHSHLQPPEPLRELGFICPAGKRSWRWHPIQVWGMRSRSLYLAENCKSFQSPNPSAPKMRGPVSMRLPTSERAVGMKM